MIKGYYFITDDALSRAGNLSDVKNAVSAGVTVVQYRNKSGSTRQMHEEALALNEICKDILFIVNDRIDIALSAGAGGVHIGQDDMPYESARKLLGPHKTIGVTVHNLEEALEAERLGADYLGTSPIFSTSTKTDAGAPCGVATIAEIKKKCRIPVVAIGGITMENAPEVIRAGADAICAISAVVARDNVREEIEKINELFEKYG
jgi:thiamine-phosphate pyrophosphorylase